MLMERQDGRIGRATKWMCGTALSVASVLAAPAAFAADAPTQVDEIVVTGTSIRGVAPVGSSVVAVGQDQIQSTGAQTIQQVLKSVPSVVGLGAAGQGAFGSADGAGTNAPTIHGLGASASNSTLILIDGHRLPLSGINHALADPNIIAPLALERVEVLSDGASSVYGSDAVAGVINFITRRDFDGFEASAQYGFGQDYHTTSAAFVAGKTWEGGSVLASYGYSDRAALSAGDRDYTHADHRGQGGSNLASFVCAPASIQPAGSTTIYGYPYTSGVSNAAANAFCDYTGIADLIPAETRHSMLVKIQQDVGDRLSLTGDVVYSKRDNQAKTTRGNVTATIFGPGSGKGGQINPFYVFPTGSVATTETVRFQGDDLLGPGAHIDSGEETFYVSGGAEFRINDNWRATLGGVVGNSQSRQQILGALCTSCALLALNGTTNGGGNLTTPSIPGTSTIILNSPLTATNALDPFHPLGSNLTSAAVRAALTDSTQTSLAKQTIKDATFKLDGTLFDMPAGPLRVAVGAETIRYTMKQDNTRPLGIGPATTGSATTNLTYERSVNSAFVEALVPLVGPEMNIPLVRRLDVNLSGRYDKYSDFGETSNPKIGVNWEVIDGLKFRANYAESFVAPALTSRGDANGITGESGFGNYALGTVNVPLAAYPSLAGVPGCVAGATTCQLGSTITGVQITGGNKNLKPQTGKSWSVGADFQPAFVPGLRLSVTYWNTQIEGGITAPSAALAVNAAGLNNLLTIYPAGATPAQIAAATAGLPQTSSLPPAVYFTYNFQQQNALNLWVAGVDVSASYNFDTPMGGFSIDAIGSYKTRFRQQVGTGGAKFDVLNTTGFNTTFPSVKLETRVGLGWEHGDLSANVYWNHTGSYRNYSGTTVTSLTRNAAGVPTGGGDKVDANNTFDLHVQYDIPGDNWMGKTEVFVDATNLFDKDPPFFNATAGYDNFVSSPIGRVITVGARLKY